MKVPWTDHKTNEEILQMVETERKIIDTVRSRQKRWLGHILRHDSLLRITLEGQILLLLLLRMNVIATL